MINSKTKLYIKILYNIRKIYMTDLYNINIIKKIIIRISIDISPNKISIRKNNIY